jgi:phenylacetate-CoA ligase
MPSLDKLYSFAPISLQNLAISLYGRRLMRQRYGREYRSAFDLYRNKTYSSLSAELSLQLSELKGFIEFAARKSPYYGRLYSKVRLDRISAIDDLEQLPVVDKEALRLNIDDVYTVSPDDAIEAFTGGTTGKSLRVLFTVPDFQRRMAYLDAFKVRCGIDPFLARKATFSGRTFARGIFQSGRNIFWRDNKSYNQRLYSTFDLTQQNIPYYVANLNSFRPVVINGFVSALYCIASYVVEHDCCIDFRPKAIFTTSETLLPHHRTMIESAFGCKIFNQYASAEGAPFITECALGNLHYNLDTGIIEVKDLGNGPEMLVTSFTSHGTPLIRYRIGDTVTLTDEQCACGHCHPLVKSIDGRKVDFLFSRERGRVSLSHLADVIKGLPNCIKEMQFIQNSLTSIRVDLVADKTYDASAEEMIKNAMVFRFGTSVEIEIERVSVIPREASGKFALIKNLMEATSAGAAPL